MTSAAKLLRWFDAYGRELPWRRTRDPYRILVSELMLQQTQVPRVLGFYPKWLAAFPTWEALAAASTADVIKAWAGLGYNRRALMLRDIARQVVARGVPQTEAAWRELKGVGPYTSAALAAFSLHQRTMPVDTNIRRVLSRLLLGEPFPGLKDDDRIRAAAESFLPAHGRFFDVPQAVFDLATMVCMKTPNCAVCPLASACRSAEKFLAGSVVIPRRSVKKAVESRHVGKRHPDRIFRGRILKLVREAEGLPLYNLGKRIDEGFEAAADTRWLAAMVTRLVADGLVVKKGTRLYLPT
jgi:A/G-specific adenine glycosylase